MKIYKAFILFVFIIHFKMYNNIFIIHTTTTTTTCIYPSFNLNKSAYKYVVYINDDDLMRVRE
jgi:hypothetical protein